MALRHAFAAYTWLGVTLWVRDGALDLILSVFAADASPEGRHTFVF